MGDRHAACLSTEATTFGFIDACSLDEFRRGAVTLVSVDGHDFALLNVGGRPVAIGDLCVRCGASLASGTLSHEALTCPGCGWQYDLLSCSVVGLPALRIEALATRIEGDRVLVGFERTYLPVR